MVKILHLSHTDIRSDSRILKEMNSLNCIGEYELVGVGVEAKEGSANSSQTENLTIHSIQLVSRKITYIPRELRHALTMMELTIKAFIIAFKEKPNVIHCHDTLVLPLGILVKCFRQSRLVYDAHELESDKNGQSWVLSKLTLYVEKLCWPFVDVVISVSDSIHQWYQDHLGKKEGVVILNAPILNNNLASQEPVNNEYFRRKFDVPEEKKIFVYVGILGKGRGLEKIIEVFSDEACKSHVVFLGYGDLSAFIGEKASDFENLHLHEAVPHEDVVRIVQSADVGLCLIENVSLSDYYCLPNKLFEYCFSGIPVLASDFPDITRVVGKYKLGLCCGLSMSAIGDAIKSYENNLVTISIDKDQLYDLSWEAQEKKLIGIYRKCIEDLKKETE